MEVFGHDNISDDEEGVFFTGIFEYFEEDVSRLWGAQKSQPSITTTSNEMKITLTVVAD